MTRREQIDALSPAELGEELCDYISAQHALLHKHPFAAGFAWSENAVKLLEVEWERNFWELKAHKLAETLSAYIQHEEELP